MYADGSIKIAGYDRSLTVTEVQTRAGGSHVFIGVKELEDAPRKPATRAADMVTVSRSVRDTLTGLGHSATAGSGGGEDADLEELGDDGNPI